MIVYPTEFISYVSPQPTRSLCDIKHHGIQHPHTHTSTHRSARLYSTRALALCAQTLPNDARMHVQHWQPVERTRAHPTRVHTPQLTVGSRCRHRSGRTKSQSAPVRHRVRLLFNTTSSGFKSNFHPTLCVVGAGAVLSSVRHCCVRSRVSVG